ncbi:RNA-binding protein [Ancylobacter sp. VKM B-3255]|uniref:RNA-binding protein n=2 Tax=Ancylobacter radicis TaxID=2836179 RepID=A0ABS5R6U8_9HYPH|nr:RNA-binding protein [Ancylobacter radicis]
MPTVDDEAGPVGPDPARAAGTDPDAEADAPEGAPDDTDAGPAAVRRETTRQCLATRAVLPVAQMLRFVVGPDGAVVPDLAARLPGRGAWVAANRGALRQALKKKAFSRAFRGQGRAEEGLCELVEALLEKDALAALALANKAGQVVTGNSKVVEALQSAAPRPGMRRVPVAGLMHAADAAADGMAKLDALARRVGEAAGREIVRVVAFPGAQLDLALGRANVVHAALLAHPTSAGFLARVTRLEGWRAE